VLDVVRAFYAGAQAVAQEGQAQASQQAQHAGNGQHLAALGFCMVSGLALAYPI